jgi:hypothetical protein
MHKFTFQIGSHVGANQPMDTSFERALRSLRAAVVGEQPVLAPVQRRRRYPTRFEARLHNLSSDS